MAVAVALIAVLSKDSIGVTSLDVTASVSGSVIQVVSSLVFNLTTTSETAPKLVETLLLITKVISVPAGKALSPAKVKVIIPEASVATKSVSSTLTIVTPSPVKA